MLSLLPMARPRGWTRAHAPVLGRPPPAPRPPQAPFYGMRVILHYPPWSCPRHSDLCGGWDLFHSTRITHVSFTHTHTKHPHYEPYQFCTAVNLMHTFHTWQSTSWWSLYLFPQTVPKCGESGRVVYSSHYRSRAVMVAAWSHMGWTWELGLTLPPNARTWVLPASLSTLLTILDWQPLDSSLRMALCPQAETKGLTVHGLGFWMQCVQTHASFQVGPPCELALCVTRVACSLVQPCGRERVLYLSSPKGFVWHVHKASELPPFFSTKPW